MTPSLNSLRTRLTSAVRPPARSFYSIEFEPPLEPGRLPVFQAGEVVTLQLGVSDPPTDLLGYLFSDATGGLLTELEVRSIPGHESVLACRIRLPDAAPSGVVTLVIEGRWTDGMAGAEISCKIAQSACSGAVSGRSS